MKKLFALLLIFTSAGAFCQADSVYFQQKVDYNIEVTLNEVAKTLDGTITLVYQNNSPDTLHFIWFHLWPNAFKNDRTAFSEQLLKLGRTDFYFSNEEQRGFINRLDFKVQGLNAKVEDHPLYIDVVKLILPHPLPPGGQTIIATPFHVKIPYNFSRGGYIGNSFQITQWYPKPAVYDRKGWHPMPYLDQGEFYSEFGKFDVKITAPEEYVIAATGNQVAVSVPPLSSTIDPVAGRQNEEFTDSINILSSTSGLKQASINKPLIGHKKKAIPRVTGASGGRTKTWTFEQDRVHDFAWFADKTFILAEDTLSLGPGKVITVSAYYLQGSEIVWKNSVRFLKNAIRTHSSWLGEYPYHTIKAVETRMAFSGGMEYPTITNISPVENEKTLDLLIAHETGHNWTYGILASNERDHPWMDEGMNTFYDNRYETMKYPVLRGGRKNFPARRIPDDFTELAFRNLIATKKDQPVETESAKFSEDNYALIAYYKAGQWMKKLEEHIGEEDFNLAMKKYFETWKFRHPYPEDFKKIIEEVSQKNVDSLFALLTKKGSLTPNEKKHLRVKSFFSLRETWKYHYLFLSPAMGTNYYDRLMLGGLLHNYTLPETRLHFFIAPMYGTGSGRLTGMGRVGYHIMSYGLIRKAEISLSAAKFSINNFTDSTGTNNYMGFHKFVPSVKILFNNNGANDKLNKYIQWKTFIIKETGLLFLRDTITQQYIITYPGTRRHLNQLTVGLENQRALYPFQLRLVAEQGKGFARLAFDGNYFFNYPTGGGLDLRLFAGKFLYLGSVSAQKKYQYKRYHLNMTGPNGYEDYTYSNYFVGRNEFEKYPSQQIMIRDGAFKVRTDLLNTKTGTSDNWLAALNFKTDIPQAYNPLQVLPFKMPLKVFLDVGTYPGAWEKQAEMERFVFDAGIQLSFFKDMLNIYFPILYSKVYREYFQSTLPKEKIFWRNISFSLDIQKFRLNQFISLPSL